jgi:hypothetical protein
MREGAVDEMRSEGSNKTEETLFSVLSRSVVSSTSRSLMTKSNLPVEY